jgi:hypothetical protein
MIKDAYNRDILEYLKNAPILTPASTHGDKVAIEIYLRAMVNQFDRTQCTYLHCEYAMHNYLHYLNILYAEAGVDESEVFIQGDGSVNSIGLAYLNGTAIYDHGDIWNEKMGRGDQLTWAVHQYTHHSELKKVVEGEIDNIIQHRIDYDEEILEEETTTPLGLVGDGSIVVAKPSIGKHRNESDAIFCIADDLDYRRMVQFLTSIQGTGFEGDIVMSISRQNRKGSKIHTFLERFGQNNNNLVVYEDVFTKIDDNYQIHGLYGQKPGQTLDDPRPAREKAVAHHE